MKQLLSLRIEANIFVNQTQVKTEETNTANR